MFLNDSACDVSGSSFSLHYFYFSIYYIRNIKKVL